MELIKIQGYTEANLNSLRYIMEKEDHTTPEETILKNFNYLIAMAVTSGIQKYHGELRKQIMTLHHIDIGAFDLFIE